MTTARDQGWVEMARIVENLGGEVQTLVETGGREAERLGGLEEATRALQEAVHSMSPQHGTRVEEHRQTTRNPTYSSETTSHPWPHQQNRLQTVEPEVQVGGRI